MTIGVGTIVSNAGGWTNVLDDRDTAATEAQSEFTARFTDITDPATRAAMWDAYRHTYVSGRLIQMGYSEDFVHLLGTVREIPQQFTSPNDSNMDRYNNELGRSIGLVSPSQSVLALAIESAVRDETAIVYKNSDSRHYEGGSPPISAADMDDLADAPPALAQDPEEPVLAGFPPHGYVRLGAWWRDGAVRTG